MLASEGPALATHSPRTSTPRAALRHKVFRAAWLDTAGGRTRAHVLNLSELGACVHARCAHPVWSAVTLDIAGRRIDGRVTWTADDRCGVKFTRPLAPAELLAMTR